MTLIYLGCYLVMVGMVGIFFSIRERNEKRVGTNPPPVSPRPIRPQQKPLK